MTFFILMCNLTMPSNRERVEEVVELVYERLVEMVQRAVLMDRGVVFLSEAAARAYAGEVCCGQRLDAQRVCGLFGVLCFVEDTFISGKKFEARMTRWGHLNCCVFGVRL